MRTNALVFTLAMTLASMTGCAQRCFLNEQDYKRSHEQLGLPPGLETDTTLNYRPTTDAREPAPPTIDDPEREPYYLSLAEAIAIALEKGSTGIQSVRQPGGINEDLVTGVPTGGFQVGGSDSVRVLTLNPAIAGATIDAALARFDAKWVTSMGTGTTDQPIQGFNSFSNGDNGRFVSTLVKPLPTGGLAGITFSTLYQDLTSPPTNFPLRNPSYTPRLQFTFEHSLWQSFGIDTNQLLSRPPLLGNLLSQIHPEASQFYQGHPLNLQNQGAGSGINPSGILITRTSFDQSRAELERVVNFTLYNVEVAYWNLYGSYISLYAAEQALRFGYETYRLARLKFESGKLSVERAAQSLGQFEQFRGDRLQALDRVLEAERLLRSLLGLPASDNKRLVPVDSPTLAPYVPRWETALEETLNLRPELVVARQELRKQQYNLAVQYNFLKPDLRFQSQFGVNGLGSSLSGDAQFFDQTIGRSRSDNALRSLASAHYNDWSMGLTLNIPIGFRFEHASVRAAKLQLAQGFLAVQREEAKAKLFLRKTYEDVIANWRLIRARRAQREAFAEQLDARFKLFRAGQPEATIEFVLQAQQQWANALNQEYQAVVAYNNSLASFQFAKGTIMTHDNVILSEGAIPTCAQVRAVEHERQRSKALVLRERAGAVAYAPPTSPDHVPWMPKLPVGEAPSLPALRMVGDKNDRLPVPDELEDAPLPEPLAPAALPKAVELKTTATSAPVMRANAWKAAEPKAAAAPAVSPAVPRAILTEGPALPLLPTTPPMAAPSLPEPPAARSPYAPAGATAPPALPVPPTRSPYTPTGPSLPPTASPYGPSVPSAAPLPMP